MTNENCSSIVQTQTTRSAFLWNRMLGIPFWAILNLLPVILHKDLHISSFQLTILITLKPVSALLAPYWSQYVCHREDRLVSNIAWANLLRYLPFLALPWMTSSWLIILFFSLYMMLTRGAMPAWMEVLKRHLPEVSRERVFVYGTAVDYLGNALLPLILGIVMDEVPQAWRWIFAFSALLGLCSIPFLYQLPTLSKPIDSPSPVGWKDYLIQPWKQAWLLIGQRKDFSSFLMGFMLGGSGLMIVQPILPAYFVDVLNLSYTEIALALVSCKAIGFALTSPAWLALFRRTNPFQFSGIVVGIAALYPFFLLGAQYQLVYLYAGYLLYGVMQAGSELSWHMSGPLFSRDQDSSVYSSANVLTVGVRGCIIPILGAGLYAIAGSTTVFLIGALLSLLATRQLLQANHLWSPAIRGRGDIRD